MGFKSLLFGTLHHFVCSRLQPSWRGASIFPVSGMRVGWLAVVEVEEVAVEVLDGELTYAPWLQPEGVHDVSSVVWRSL